MLLSSLLLAGAWASFFRCAQAVTSLQIGTFNLRQGTSRFDGVIELRFARFECRHAGLAMAVCSRRRSEGKENISGTAR